MSVQNGPFPNNSNKITVVAIGASAGGIEAVTELLNNLTTDTRMAFVYIQHLDPTHESNLSAILGRETQMPVVEAIDKVTLEEDHFYIIPPNSEMTVLDGTITIEKHLTISHSHRPINKFFSSLADNYREASIGIVLSGAANDGTVGLKAIKLAGGLTFAQDETAKFQSMPKSALADGAVDLVLSPKEIAEELKRIAAHKDLYFSALRDVDDEVMFARDEELQNILVHLYKMVGVDFRQYKTNTISRRIMRRMILHKLDTLTDYAQYLKQHANEASLLYQDLLINVTTFFRDRDVSDYLKKSLLPSIIKAKGGNEPIRIWVPACSTGQEVYSMAIILFEVLGVRSPATSIQIFATDLSEAAINKARMGVYNPIEVEGISESRLNTYFTKVDGHFRIIKAIRDICIFAPHNIAKDPPFSRLDVISCCNLLIYLDNPLQKKIFSTFHYSLNQNGYLILGKSEAIGTSSHLFSLIDRKLKIYIKKKDAIAKAMFEMNYRLPKPDNKSNSSSKTAAELRRENDLEMEKKVDALLLKKYTPASVVVDKDLDILQFRGPIGVFLEPSPGRASLNLIKMARAGLGFELKNIVHKAKKSGEPCKKDGLEITHDGKILPVSIEATPIKADGEDEYYLVVFDEEMIAPPVAIGTANDKRVKQLEGELLALREDMRSIIESQEAANEELQSANEEIVSSNEELQSINEELETSKEEIESSNEELITINHELQERNEQLSELQEYSEAVFGLMREAMLVLDKDLRVKNANTAFYKIFKVSEEETLGRYIFELGNKQWNIFELRNLLEEVIPQNSKVQDYRVQHIFESIGEKVMLLNACRINQSTHNYHVVLITLDDITDLVIK